MRYRPREAAPHPLDLRQVVGLYDQRRRPHIGMGAKDWFAMAGQPRLQAMLASRPTSAHRAVACAHLRKDRGSGESSRWSVTALSAV